MSQDPDKEPELKIIDKRRFNPDGTKTAGSVEEPPRVQEPAKPVAPAKAPVEKNAGEKSPPPVSAAHPQKGADAAQTHEDGQPRVDFASFLMSLATQALVMLGEIPNPETRLTTMNLGAARQTIDILDMLEQKTRGNLSEEESQLLAELVSSLQLSFVEKIRGGGRSQ